MLMITRNRNNVKEESWWMKMRLIDADKLMEKNRKLLSEYLLYMHACPMRKAKGY